jgi:hypothetical protein
MDEETRRRLQERQARIADTLIRASTDMALRQQLIAEPAALFDPLDQPRPVLPEHVIAMRRDIITHLIDAAATNAEFRDQLRQDLFKAIRATGLLPKMEQLRAELPINAEVTGYGWGWGNPWGWPGIW